ncbi:hypothetical protein H4S14_000094 [Agrobacterium vitis]|nr:hypothetical protein [Agrobacterium vitis]MBE1436367.1 hypothetical protein [Agrobacterium vitis]
MGADFTFIATSAASGVSLYEAAWQAGQYWAAYLLPATGSAPPKDMSYTDTLSSVYSKGSYTALYPGSYIFASTRPAGLDVDPDSFIDSVTSYINNQNLDAGSQVILWVTSVDPITFGTPFNDYSIVFSCNAISGQFNVTSNWNANLGLDLTFNILSNTTLKIDATSGSLNFSAPANYTQTIAFSRGHSTLGIALVSDGSRLNAYLPFTGTNAGCCLFSATIQPTVTFGSGGLPLGFQFTATDTSSGTAQTDNFYYPAFSPAALPSTLPCIGTVDVLDPFNQLIPAAALSSGVLRTGFILTGGTTLASCFCNTQGNQISLLPLGGTTAQPPQIPLQAGGFALTTNATVPSDPTTAVPALTLSGQFGVSTAMQSPGQTVQLLCGIYGSEKIALTAYDATAASNDILLFCLGGAAYAPVFPFTTASLNQPSSGNVVTPLTSTSTTAWATVVQGAATAPSYSAEPAGSPMFGFPDTISGDTIILESQPPTLPLPQGVAHTFPLVPYGGLTDTTVSGSTLASFESSIIAPTRKQIVSAGATTTWAARANATNRAARARNQRRAGLAVEQDTSSVYRSTPQGLIATVDPDSGTYLSVTLGQTVDSTDAILPFGFQLPSLKLQDALQTNQLFLVIVNPDNLVAETDDFENTLEIAGWSMKAKVGDGVSATQYANVMVMKYCEGSFADMIGNPNQWTAQADFSLPSGTDSQSSVASVSYTGLSAWLQDLVKAAESAVAADASSPYANFVSLVNDPDWNGVLVLQANLDSSSLPDGLAGIVAGIDMTQFKAHHFGFTASRLSTNADGTITFNGNSSTFGLIDYTNQTFATNLAAGVSPDTPISLSIANNYAFSVLQLQVLFDNAAVQTFKSYLELGVGTLFTSNVLSTTFGGTTMPSNGVVLNGSYVDQNGVGVYIFVQDTTTVFTLDSNILPAIAFTRVQFNCMGTTDDGATVLNRFFIWGSFDFTQINDTDGALFDVLSFGDDDAASDSELSGAGLSFSSLLIDMTYPQTTPNAVSFVENTQNLSWDLANSIYRNNSLFQGFGLQLSGFIAAGSNEMPADYGYLTVSSDLNLTAFSSGWYGVTYNVTMGGPGALASAAGFNSSLLVAWSPDTTADDTSYSLFMGLSLPGAAPGAKLISLQGVFKVAVDSIALSRQKVPDPNSSSYYYCLRLNNIGLKILGIAKLPPDGSINFFLFGDPGSSSSPGWYAAYNRNVQSTEADETLLQ